MRLPAVLLGFFTFFFGCVLIHLFSGGLSAFATANHYAFGYDAVSAALGVVTLGIARQVQAVFQHKAAERRRVDDLARDLKVLNRQPGID